MKKLSIVIPCYNEGANVPLIVEKFSEIITRKDIEVVLVNNGSTDETANFLKKMKKPAWLNVVNVPVNQGYGHGILSGLAAAKGEFIGWTHADLQTDPADLLKALALLEQDDRPEGLYVKGTRKGRPLFDSFFTVGMSFFELFFMGRWLWDINAQPNVFHRSFYEGWQDPPADFSLDLFVLYMAKENGLRVRRFPVLFPERQHGESKWNTGFASKIKFIKRTMAFSRELRKRLKSPGE